MSLLNRAEVMFLSDVAVRVGAVRFGEFTLASGRKSDFYFDGRRVTLSQEGLGYVANAMAGATVGVASVGGPATAAVPMVAGYLAKFGFRALDTDDPLPKRGFYVRESPKAHGLGNVVEGLLEKGDKVLLVDDTLTSGGSLLKAAAAVREAGAEVVRVMVLLDRGEGGAKAVSDALGVDVFSALTRADLEAAVARTGGAS